MVSQQTDTPRTSRQAYLVGKLDQRSVTDAYDLYRAPEEDLRSVQIIRPFSVSSKTTYSAPITLPIGPAYLASVLEKAGYRVEAIDGIGEDIFSIKRSPCDAYNLHGMSIQKILERLNLEAAVIGVSLMFSQEWLIQRDLINAIAKHCPNAVIVVGGEHVTALPEYVLRDCPVINFAITGEGELSFLNLVHNIFTGKPTNQLPGCAFLDQDGTFISNGLSNRIDAIDELPRPAWHLYPVENYFIDIWTMGVSKGRNMPILGTRGCPYQCTFCSNPTMWTTRYKMREVQSVVDEIEDLIKTYDANSLDFFDLTAIVKKQWIIEFCDEIKKRGLKFTWQLPSGTRSEALDEETLGAIKDTGCEYLVYAPESGSEETLRHIKKKLKLKNLTESIRQAVKVGHVIKVNLIIGFPHEQFKHVAKTVAYAFRMALIGAEDCNIAKFSPYPGSELFRELRSNGKIPTIDDNYIRSLVSQFDITARTTYCPRVPTRVLGLATILGHGLFYTTAYLTHPSRILRILKGLLKGSFSPINLFEQRVYDLIMRFKLVEKPNRPKV
jgi:anaerobic magnesium-protoporphyrin IX monomethyl ester cyclase